MSLKTKGKGKRLSLLPLVTIWCLHGTRDTGHGTHWNLVCLLGSAKSNVSLQLTFPRTHMLLPRPLPSLVCLLICLTCVSMMTQHKKWANPANKAANASQSKLNSYRNNKKRKRKKKKQAENQEQEPKQRQIGNWIFPFISQETNRKKMENLYEKKKTYNNHEKHIREWERQGKRGQRNQQLTQAEIVANVSNNFILCIWVYFFSLL